MQDRKKRVGEESQKAPGTKKRKLKKSKNIRPKPRRPNAGKVHLKKEKRCNTVQ